MTCPICLKPTEGTEEKPLCGSCQNLLIDLAWFRLIASLEEVDLSNGH